MRAGFVPVFALAVLLVNGWTVARAGLIEDLLARPAIQSLLGQPDLKALMQRCSDASYRQKNAAICQQVEAANRLARIPPEVRSLLASPASAASIRELCLAVQVTSARNSYLCKELTIADLDFAALARNADTARQQQQVQDRQLDR